MLASENTFILKLKPNSSASKLDPDKQVLLKLFWERYENFLKTPSYVRGSLPTPPSNDVCKAGRGAMNIRLFDTVDGYESRSFKI